MIIHVVSFYCLYMSVHDLTARFVLQSVHDLTARVVTREDNCLSNHMVARVRLGFYVTSSRARALHLDWDAKL